LQRINDAYETLADSYKRMMYDVDPKSVVGIPSESGANSKGVDGFDRWYARELEKEGEREKDLEAQRSKDSMLESTDEDKRRSARAIRRSKVALLPSRQHTDSKETARSAERAGGMFSRLAAAAHVTPEPNPSSGAVSSRNSDFAGNGRSSSPTMDRSAVPSTGDGSDSEVASKVAATAARARAAVAQAEAFVRLVQAQSSGVDRLHSARKQASVRGDQPDANVPGTTYTRLSRESSGGAGATAGPSAAEDDIDDGMDVEQYRRFLSKVAAGHEDLGHGDAAVDDIIDELTHQMHSPSYNSDVDISAMDDDVSEDGQEYSGSDFDEILESEEEGVTTHIPTVAQNSSFRDRTATRMPSLAELEAQLAGLTAEAQAAAAAAKGLRSSP
jgi:curved DNA-binding protein CbpA